MYKNRREEEKKLAEYLEKAKNAGKCEGNEVSMLKFENILTEMERRGIIPHLYEEFRVINRKRGNKV